MRNLLFALLLTVPLASTAQTTQPRHHAAHHRTAARPAVAANPKVYVCGGSAYAYHNSDNCNGLNRCSHGVSAVTVAEAEGMGRRPCKKCH
jgi:hypothetical protein